MTRVKICGITSLEDAVGAAAAGADLLGFIFFPKSPRCVSPAQAAGITSGLKSRLSFAEPGAARIPRFVGVFVNEPLEAVEETLRRAQLDYAQLHGDEPPALVEALQGRGFKALRPSNATEAAIDAEWYADLGPADGPQLLIDAYDANEYGGTGKKTDWQAAAELGRQYPRLVLAGGLTPGNVAAAVRTVRPWAVDVSSGVEDEPGRKDADKVRAFVCAAKRTGAEPARAVAD